MTKPIDNDVVDGGGAGPLILQSQLEALQTARKEKNEADARAQQHRADVLQRYDSHAGVEEGPLGLRVHEREQQQITADAVVAVFGREALKVLLGTIPVRTVRTVFVVDRGPERCEDNDLLFYEGWENE